MDTIAFALANLLKAEYIPDSVILMANSPAPAREFPGASINGKGYVFSGYYNGAASSSVYEYDPILNTWASKANIPTARTNATAFAINGLAYVVGGRLSSGLIRATNESFNPATNSWSTKADIPTPRDRMGSFVIDNKGYVPGGGNDVGYQRVLEEYNPTTNTWVNKSYMPDPFAHGPACFVLRGKGYAVGAHSGGGATYQTRTYEYDPNTNAWTTKQAPPVYLTSSGAFSDGLNGYLIGGVPSGGGKTDSVYQYDVDNNIWNTKKSLLYRNSLFAIFEIDGNAYICGGDGAYTQKYTPEKKLIIGLEALLSWIATQ